MNKKKYILKPGRHQFAPKSPPIHENANLTDEEAQWYLEKYPHIKELFIPEKAPAQSSRQIVKIINPFVQPPSEISVTENNNEDLLTTN
jgi:hypothetical protein